MVLVDKLGNYIERLNRPNSDLQYGIDDVCGITNTKQLVLGTKANLIGRTFEKFTILSPGEFIFNRRTSRNGERISLGFNATDRDWILTEDYCHFRIRKDKKDVLDPDYLYLFFLNPEFDRYARYNSWGSATEFFNWEELIETPVPIIPISDQRKIVHNYQVIMDRIELLRKMNENLEEQANNVYRKMFGSYDVLEKDIALPEGWRVIPAEDVFNISIGKTPPREETECFTYNRDDVTWVSIADMKKANPFIIESTEKLTDDAVVDYNVKTVPKNTVLLSFKMTVGRVAIADREMTTNEAIAHFPCSLENLYYTYCMLSNYNYLKLGSTSSITTAINSKIIKAMPILWPSADALHVFSNATDAFFSMMKQNATEMYSLNHLGNMVIAKMSR